MSFEERSFPDLDRGGGTLAVELTGGSDFELLPGDHFPRQGALDNHIAGVDIGLDQPAGAYEKVTGQADDALDPTVHVQVLLPCDLALDHDILADQRGQTGIRGLAHAEGLPAAAFGARSCEGFISISPLKREPSSTARRGAMSLP